MEQILKILQDETGATAVEYALIVAAIAAVIIVAVIGIGSKVNTAFNTVNTTLP